MKDNIKQGITWENIGKQWEDSGRNRGGHHQQVDDHRKTILTSENISINH